MLLCLAFSLETVVKQAGRQVDGGQAGEQVGRQADKIRVWVAFFKFYIQSLVIFALF